MPTGHRPPPPPGALKITFNYSYGTRTAQNICWASWSYTTGNPTGAELTTLANSIMTEWGATVLAPLSEYCTLSSVTLEAFGASGTVFTGSSTDTALNGTASGQGLTNQVAVCLSWQTGLYYRGGKPRTYLPGIPASALASGYNDITTTFRNTLQTDAAAALATYNGYSLLGEPIVFSWLSFAKAGAWLEPPVLRAITGVEVGLRLDTQRRRLGKEGPL
jgi:hypothetical protein